MYKIILLFLAIEYGAYLEEKFDALQHENLILRSALIESLEMEYFSLRIKERTDIEEFRFRELEKQLKRLE